MKPAGNPKICQIISLLCVPYKILEKPIYARVEPLIDPLLPKEQAGFQHGKSTVDQVVLLTQNIEDFFDAKKITGTVFVNLGAAYDTCLALLFCVTADEAFSGLAHGQKDYGSCSKLTFSLTTGDSKKSRLRRLKNGVLQKSVLTLLLFNIYTYNLPFTIFRKFAFANHLALLLFSVNWKDSEEILSQDITTLSAYFQTWRSKLSHTKTVTEAFQLNNRDARRDQSLQQQ